MFSGDILGLEGTVLATFADDAAIMATVTGIERTAERLQTANSVVNNWTKSGVLD